MSGAGNLGPERQFREALASDRFELQVCGTCDRTIYYPRILCPYCHCVDLRWRKMSGNATISACTTYANGAAGPVYMALVDLDEGARIQTRIEDEGPGVPVIGDRVVARIVPHDLGPVLIFRRTA